MFEIVTELLWKKMRCYQSTVNSKRKSWVSLALITRFFLRKRKCKMETRPSFCLSPFLQSNDTMCWCSEAYMDKMLFLCWAQTHPFVDERWDFRLPITLGCREVKHSGQNPPAQPALCGRLLGTSAQLAELPKQVEEVNCCRTALFTPDELPGTSCESEFKSNILSYWTF